jgi:thymidine kinase
MANVFPSLENIQRLKVKPTVGESFLVHHLVKTLPNEVEIYFQPFLNGDMPDIILMQKNIGVTIIEVKDWNLSLYEIDENNHWYLKQNKAKLKSPFQQVFNYKDNMFNLHINGLLQEKIKNIRFYGRINVYVYFHNATKKEITSLFNSPLDHFRDLEEKYRSAFEDESISEEEFDKKLENIKKKKKKLERDKLLSIGNDSIEKISLPKNYQEKLFKESIYKEFRRYLQPPFHVVNQGKDIIYSKDQQKLINSQSIFQKIIGVAGSGKTVLLAKRAVNAHKRHGDRVLILSYNITLKQYIHDKISDVREDFSWNAFYITNYHQLITLTLNNLEIDFNIPKSLSKHEISEYLDRQYYSNPNLFESHIESIPKYQSIFIDEIQDYSSEWIKIIKKFFLEENGEMILLGDPKQNIYNRKLKDRMPVLVQGFGAWQYLKKSIRYQGNGDRIQNLAKAFQSNFMKDKYELDFLETITSTPSLNLELYKYKYYIPQELEEVVKNIFEEIKNYNIHPNDICILSSNINMLQEIDFIVRNVFNEKTLTTFETKELAIRKPKEVEHVRKRKKIGFNLNSGVLKISTIHSFKGYEIPTLFLIIDDNDNDEMIYTGITRSKFNLMLFGKKENKYNDFFERELGN